MLRAVFFILAFLASAPAFAANDSRAFPPDNCTVGSPFMGFTGVSGSNTFCNSGQDVLKNAIPTCAQNQVVSYDGSKFYCKSEANVPTCTPGTFLSFDGTNYTCQSTGVATCGNNQVLTFNGTSYFCVNKDASIPVCSANQFLTYNGSYQCAAVQTPAPLNIGCPAGQVLMGISNNQPVCVDGGNSNAGSCQTDVYQYYMTYWGEGNWASANLSYEFISGKGAPNSTSPGTELGRSTAANATLVSHGTYPNGTSLFTGIPAINSSTIPDLIPFAWYAAGNTTPYPYPAVGYGSDMYQCQNGSWIKR